MPNVQISSLRNGGFATVFLAVISGLCLTFASYAQTRNIAPSQMSVGECAARATIISGLESEGQTILVTANAIGINNVDGSSILLRDALTTNDTFDRGYHFSENAQGQFCKSADIVSIKLLEERSSQVDIRALNQPAGQAGNGTLNGALLASKNIGQFPMLQAYSPANGIVVTVVGNTNNGSGAILFSTINGLIYGSGVYETVSTTYSPTAIANLDMLVSRAP